MRSIEAKEAELPVEEEEEEKKKKKARTGWGVRPWCARRAATDATDAAIRPLQGGAAQWVHNPRCRTNRAVSAPGVVLCKDGVAACPCFRNDDVFFAVSEQRLDLQQRPGYGEGTVGRPDLGVESMAHRPDGYLFCVVFPPVSGRRREPEGQRFRGGGPHILGIRAGARDRCGGSLGRGGAFEETACHTFVPTGVFWAPRANIGKGPRDPGCGGLPERCCL